MFNDEYGLTRTVLKRRKTQTRRIVPKSFFTLVWDKREDTLVYENDNGDFIDIRDSKYALCKAGEVVAIAQSYESLGMNPEIALNDRDGIGFYTKTKFAPGWKNKMFVRADLMPHHIRITNIKIERLQDISDECCLKEGIYKDSCDDDFHSFIFYDFEGNKDEGFDTPLEAFAVLIDKISGKGTWESNPYVFVYDFELVD